MQAIMCDNCLTTAGDVHEFQGWIILEQKSLRKPPSVADLPGLPPALAAALANAPEASMPQVVTDNHAELCSPTCAIAWIENGFSSAKRDERYPDKPSGFTHPQLPQDDGGVVIPLPQHPGQYL